jgi:hypothetical protein
MNITIRQSFEIIQVLSVLSQTSFPQMVIARAQTPGSNMIISFADGDISMNHGIVLALKL